MPFASKVGVSRKIENRDQRAKLRDMVAKLVPKDSGGWIIRTVAEDLTEQSSKHEIDHLYEMWKKIKRKASSDRKSTRLNSSHSQISYAVFCLKKKNQRGVPWPQWRQL